jgi:hypothetical protein
VIGRFHKVDEKPTEDYSDIGGLDKQIRELREAVVLPMTHSEKFKTLGIRAPKGVLLYGPPGTGKTLLARACAAQTNATYLKLAGPLLVQMFIGDGAKLVRDAFALAKEKAPTIIFIDEIDAIGTKRFDSDTNGDREVQRTMLELLNQLDGFSSDDRVKIIAATNRADTLDPALLRSGRLDRKIEFPHPNEDARAQIIEIHARKMNVSGEVGSQAAVSLTCEGQSALRHPSSGIRARISGLGFGGSGVRGPGFKVAQGARRMFQTGCTNKARARVRGYRPDPQGTLKHTHTTWTSPLRRDGVQGRGVRAWGSGDGECLCGGARSWRWWRWHTCVCERA